MADLPDDVKAVLEQMFSKVKETWANSPKPLEIVRSSFPFDLQPEHQADAFHYAVREHGDYIATGGGEWHDDRRRGLRAFYALLREENLIITYHPRQGWGHQQRLPEDGDMVIRIENPTAKQKMIWRFPPEQLAP